MANKENLEQHLSESTLDYPLYYRILFYALIYAIWIGWIWFTTSGINSTSWLISWHRWDSLSYEQIYNQGYNSAKYLIVFPPLYSYIVGIASDLFKISFHTTAVIINLITFFTGLVIVGESLGKRFKISPYWLFVFTLSSPASFFVFTAYSDFVFFFLLWLLIAATLFEWWKYNYWFRFFYVLLFIVIPSIRIVGFGLFSWILLRKKIALLILLPLVFWLWINYYLYGDPLSFIKAQQLFGMPAGGFINGLKGSYGGVFNYPGEMFTSEWNLWMSINVLPIFFLILFVISSIWLAIKKEWLLCLTLLSLLFLSYNQSYWRSVVRYELPLHVLLAVPFLYISTKPKYQWTRLFFFLIILLSFLVQFYFAVFLHKGWWTY